MKKNGVKGQQIVYGFVDESGTAGAVSTHRAIMTGLGKKFIK